MTEVMRKTIISMQLLLLLCLMMSPAVSAKDKMRIIYTNYMDAGSEILNKSPDYIIQGSDKISLQLVFEGEDVHKDYDNLRPLPNGRLYIPEIGEVPSRGMTIDEFQVMLRAKVPQLDKVIVELERKRNNITVLGAVNNPGSFNLDNISTIYDAIGKANGLNDLADDEEIRLVRKHPDGTEMIYSINFSEKALYDPDSEEKTFRDYYLLQEGDLIMVPKSKFRTVMQVVYQAAKIASIGVLTGVISGAFND
jgi:protein involved in polysaccharide export with SLBB domain